MPTGIPTTYNLKENNLLLAIYQKLGGTELPPTDDIVNKVSNKLLYGILQKLTGGGGNNIANIILLPPGTSTYNIPGDTLISHITFLNVPAPFVFKMQDAAGPTTIIDDVEISNNDIIDCKKYFAINTALEFIGIDPNTIIRITKG